MHYKKLILTGFFITTTAFSYCQINFFEDFESDFQNLEYEDSSLVKLIKTKDANHKSVLQLTPNETAECVLLKNSDNWNGILIEGEVLFPNDQHSYFGLVYNYQDDERKDFGCIYLKGNGSYIRVNPHRDGNASRTLYEEFKTDLTGSQKININEWIPFKAEIIGSECHFYVKDFIKPAVVFKFYEFNSGKLGFKPRLAGGECWIDNIKVKSIKKFSAQEKNLIINHKYYKDKLIVKWFAIGPFNNRVSELENSVKNTSFLYEGENYNWSEFDTDERGCVIAGKICRYSNNQKYTYFSTVIESECDTTRILEFSSVNKLMVWTNSTYSGTIPSQQYAWFDFIINPQHKGYGIPIKLKKGSNRIVILVEGGRYGGDGYYSFLQ